MPAVRARRRRPTARRPTSSSRCTATQAPSPAACGGAGYYFQRSHYYSEHGRRLAGSIGARMEAAGVPWLGRFGRNYALLREARGIALVVEPLFLTSPDDEALARRPEHIERLARALAGGFADYLARVPLDDEEAS